MADVSVKGANWSSVTREQALLIVGAVLAEARLDISVTVTSPYEGLVGVSLWDVEAEGIGLDTVRKIEEALAEQRRAPKALTADAPEQHVTEIEDHGRDGCFPKCSCGWVGVSLSPTPEHAEARNRRHREANSRG